MAKGIIGKKVSFAKKTAKRQKKKRNKRESFKDYVGQGR